MKNKFLRGLVVLVLLGGVFATSGSTVSTSSKNVASSNSYDNRAPRCSVTIPEKLRFGKTGYGSVVCYDASGLSDTVIQPSDFEIRNVFIKKIKILEVSEARTVDGITYSWRVLIKGNFFGMTSVTLNPSSVHDNYGNGDGPTIPQYITVKFR